MSTPTPTSSFHYLEKHLKARALALRQEIHDVLLRTDAEQYVQIAGRVHDTEEESVADLLVDLNLAEITRDVEELRDIEAASQRIAVQTYGLCVRCKEPIAADRLQAYPPAKRCLECQQIYDRSRPERVPASL